MYLPNDELIQILLRNGFEEMAQVYRKNENGNISKYRQFKYRSIKNRIRFEEGTIKLFANDYFRESDFRESLSKDELISIIVFYKAPKSIQAYYNDYLESIPELNKCYSKPVLTNNIQLYRLGKKLIDHYNKTIKEIVLQS